MSTPSSTAARHLADYRLEVTFADGTQKTIDFSRWLRGPVLEPLKDVNYFKQFIVDGWTVSWPNGDQFLREPAERQDEALVSSRRPRRGSWRGTCLG
jgi:hypothetical protein